MSRDLSLNARPENIRSQQQIRHVVHFNLQEIKDRFDNSIQNIENKFDIYEQLVSLGKNDEAKDILRSQIIFIESAIDFFLHEMTKYSYFKMFSNEWAKTSQYKKFNVRMEIVEKGLNSGDSKEWFFEYVNDTFNRVVFLSNESMNDQLNAIGIPYNEVMHKVFAERNENESREKAKIFIKNRFDRRNVIAHQNDRNHDSALQNDIDRNYVEENIGTIKKIASEIYVIANSK